MKAVVLAAGFATRMYPLTRDRAKPLLEVGGRPVLDWILDQLPCEEVTVVVNHRFACDFEGYPIVDNGVAREEDRRGAVADMVLGWGRGDVLVAAGDTLLDTDFAAGLELFSRTRCPVLFTREAGPGQSRYNEVVLEDGVVVRFTEKPARPRHPVRAMCLYLFPHETLALARLYLERGGNPDAPGHFLEWLCARTTVRATPFLGRSHDVGSLQGLREAEPFLRVVNKHDPEPKDRAR